MEYAETEAAKVREEPTYKQGEGLNETQSRSILLVYSHCVQRGFNPQEAVRETEATLRIGK